MVSYDYLVRKQTKNQKNCQHNYKCTYKGWESEIYECVKCGDRYKLYDDEMK